MTEHHASLGPVGRGSDNFDGNHRHPESADLEGQPERALVIDDYASQTRGPGLLTQASVGGQDPARGRVRWDEVDALREPDAG